MIHRDIKPANILFNTNGNYKVNNKPFKTKQSQKIRIKNSFYIFIRIAG